ncbi:MAG: YfiR family protein [Desulfatitalea sp.]
MRLRRTIHILMAGWLLWSAAWPVSAQQTPASEYKIKAAFLYNFAKFIEWPDLGNSAATDAFVIGILGKDPFGPEIQVIEGKLVKGKPLRVIRSASLDELKSSQVLFIGAASPAELTRILKSLQGRPVLTVGDTDGFAREGVMINLTTEENKVRFEINPQAAEQAGLKISSHLLRLAKIVTAEGNESNHGTIPKSVD